jgi:hypothetical protein
MADTRAITAEYRLQHWAQIIQEQKASGSSIKEFCKAAGVHANVFFYWQRKLREAVCGGLVPDAQNEQKGELAPRGWAAVGIAQAEPAGPAQTLAIEIGAFRVRASLETDAGLLGKVCKVLAGLC